MGLGAALLLFACLMEHRIWAYYGPAHQPSIWAVPGSVISMGSAVTIFCRTPPDVTHVRLQQNAPNATLYERTTQRTQEVFEFSLQNMMHVNAGIYYCDYHQRGNWSRLKDKLELMVTGVYREKPSLTVDSEPQGFSERNVTLLCHTHHIFDIFILCKDGNASFPQNCCHQNRNTFSIAPVSPGCRKTYRCFGSFQNNSYMWSLPSDPLELPIPGPSVSPVVIWVSVATVCFLLFLLLFICLCLHWAKYRATNSKTRSQVKYKSSSPAMDDEEKNKNDDLETIQPENCSQVDTQVSAAEDSKEVTYAQLCQEIFMKNTDSHPSNTLQGISTQTCVYAALMLSKEENQASNEVCRFPQQREVS